MKMICHLLLMIQRVQKIKKEALSGNGFTEGENRKNRLGIKSTEELTHSKNPLTRKRAIFAQNAAKWNHKGRKKK